jgi:hypothetical protein
MTVASSTGQRPARSEERARRVRRSALLLAVLALAFYAGFIALGVLNS